MKTALVSCGTSGNGLSITKALLQNDYVVYLIGSGLKKGADLQKTLDDQHPGRAKFVALDLSNIAAVNAFAKDFAQKHAQLDLLANIAGMMIPERTITPEGFEKTFSVGYLSAFVLSQRLAPLLEKAENGKIANVGGVAKFILKERLDFDDLTFSKNYRVFNTGITTVHAKTVLSQILAEKYAERGIAVNSFDPGAVQSDLMKNMTPWKRALFGFLSIFMTKESKTGIFVCLSPEAQGISGHYFEKKSHKKLSFEESYKNRLWKETEAMLAPIN